jgi:BlaI family transcriptional regulator, penicillinase repressor
MKKNRIHRLGDLQLKIMTVLWGHGEASVSQVLESLTGHKELAYTTMATMLRKMEARGLVAHRAEGRSFIYRARLAAEEVSRGMADHLVDRLFQGSLVEAVSHLLTTREVSREELTKLERLIEERRKKL